MNSTEYSTCDTFFYHLSNQYQLIDPILLWSFLKAACHANPGAEKKEQDQANKFQDTYSKSC